MNDGVYVGVGLGGIGVNVGVAGGGIGVGVGVTIATVQLNVLFAVTASALVMVALKSMLISGHPAVLKIGDVICSIVSESQ